MITAKKFHRFFLRWRHVFFRDMTERKRTEEFREHYIHTISHDLRNPLTIVRGRTQMLLRHFERAGLTGAERQNAEAIISSAKRMSAMIQVSSAFSPTFSPTL